MSTEWPTIYSSQPPLFELNDTSTGSGELFPAVWKAVEDLSCPDLPERHAAVLLLKSANAARYSPLVAYVLATRMCEPDLRLRSEIVQMVGEVLELDGDGRRAPEKVRLHVTGYLAQMRTRHIFAILQAVEFKSELATAAGRIFTACPYAGNQLVDLLSSRKISVGIRRLAVQLIGQVGYLDAIPSLERMLARIDSRLNGQQTMPFAPPSGEDELGLRADIQNALSILRAP